MPIEIKLTLEEYREGRLVMGISAAGEGSPQLTRAANRLFDMLRMQLGLPAGEKSIGKINGNTRNGELPPPHDGLG